MPVALPVRTNLLRVGLTLGVILLLPSVASAWSAKAHRIIAGLAWAEVMKDPVLRSKVEAILGPGKNGIDPLTAVATWADEEGARSVKTRSWHFVDIPLSANNYDRNRDCRLKNCLIDKLDWFKYRVQAGSRQERIEALKYLVHLVGDLHQPLHCADNNDAGGNRVQVTFFGKVTNLHSVWDSDIIERTGLSVGSYVAKLQPGLQPQRDWFEVWALESHRLAREYAYFIPADKALGNDYYKTNLPIIDRQLTRAGARLAHVLRAVL
jgi:hypothetical protein